MFPRLFYKKPEPLLSRISEAVAGLNLSDWHLQAVQRALDKVGIKPLGSGCNGMVIDDGETVIKLFDICDEGYTAFLDLAEAYPNRYYPKIFERGQIHKRIAFVRLEKLKPIDIFGDDCGYFLNRHSSIIKIMNGKQAKANATLREAANLLFVTHKALNALDFFLTEDLHTENVMRRGDTIVITDPWC